MFLWSWPGSGLIKPLNLRVGATESDADEVVRVFLWQKFRVRKFALDVI